MPADIRSFFGGKAAAPKQESQPAKSDKATGTKRKSNSRRVIEDDSDDEVTIEKKDTPKKPAPKRAKKEEIKGEETTSADYFSSSKPKVTKATPTKPKPASTRTTPRGSARKGKTSYAELDDDIAFLEDDKDAGDDLYAADAKTTGRRKDDDYMEIDSDDEPVKPNKTSTSKSTPVRNKPITKAAKSNQVNLNDEQDNDVFVVSDDEDIKPKKASNGTKKRKTPDSESDDEDVKPAKKAAKPSVPKAAAKKPRAKKEKEPASEDPSVRAILDNVPTIRAPTPPPKDPNAKWPFGGATNGGNSGPAPGAGSKEIPTGEENCLAGLKFVFTGLLNSISREEGQELVKRYGGEVTGAPSSKTSYVVLGTDAGPSKLRKIQDLKLKSIDEDGLFHLIKNLPAHGGKGANAAASAAKKEKDAAKIREAAEEMEREEKRKILEAQQKAQRAANAQGKAAPSVAQLQAKANSDLWTTKYAPTSMQQICGNKGQVAKIQKWLHEWHKNRKRKFLIRGADGTGAERAIIIHGPPGIGKTTAAHLAAKLEGFDAIEFNASDTRSKKLVETGLSEVLNNTSMAGFFSTNDYEAEIAKKRIVLIMDEVDGMSAGDRGGVGAIAKLCKTTSIPIILICNDRKLPKMRPFDHVTYDMPFRRPTVVEVRSRVATICSREGLKLPVNVMDALIEGSNKDIRQIINMLSTAKLDQTVMDFDSTKEMSKKWEKHIVLKPWDLCHKLLGSGLFAPTSKATLNEKIELYFNDHEFSYLMIQENYLATKPMLANEGRTPKEQNLLALQLAEQAAESISDGDLVDRMIHGSQQHWTLMPTHAVFSTVRPASFVSGTMKGQTAFTQWLGNNSKFGKLARYVKEIQSHMRLRSSGDRHEIRQQYLPVLWTQLVGRLQTDGKACVEEVIDLMDSYFLTREDFDFIMELGVGPQQDEKVNIESQTKSTFTRIYNQKSHPLPFMKASNAGAAPQKATKEVPDLEEALEDEDVEEAVIEEKNEEEDDEKALKTDKYIKQPKKKPAAAKKAASKKKSKQEDAPDDEDDSEEDAKPKKGKAKSKASGKKK